MAGTTVANKKNGNGSTRLPVFVDWALKFFAILVFPILIWAIKMEIRLTTIEQTRFTTQDGLRVWTELEKRPTREDIPPAWVLDDIRMLQRKVENLEKNSHTKTE